MNFESVYRKRRGTKRHKPQKAKGQGFLQKKSNEQQREGIQRTRNFTANKPNKPQGKLTLAGSKGSSNFCVNTIEIERCAIRPRCAISATNDYKLRVI